MTKSSDILNRAAELMIEYGHAKGVLVDLDGSMCLMGSLRCAVVAQPHLYAQAGYDEYRPALDYLSNYLSTVLRTGSISLTNDKPDFTEAMAIGALHEAAMLAKEQGD